jgi:hypothetical protein
VDNYHPPAIGAFAVQNRRRRMWIKSKNPPQQSSARPKRIGAGRSGGSPQDAQANLLPPSPPAEEVSARPPPGRDKKPRRSGARF